jgi:hypothetical protein
MSTTADSDSLYTPTHRSSSDDSQSFSKDFSHLNLGKINPIPLTRKIQVQSAIEKNRLQIYQYKHFSKVSATGKTTYKVLDHLKNSPSIKTLNSLEFYPYLCDSSYLKDLTQTLKKFPKIKGLDLNIPRVDRKNESNILVPFTKRLTTLKSLRINLPTTQNITEDGKIQILEITKKGYMLKRLEVRFVNTMESSNKFEMQLMDYNRNQQKLEELTVFHSVRRGTIKEEFDYQTTYMPYTLPLLKKVDMTCSVATEWMSKTEGESQETEEFCIQFMSRFPNVEEMTCRFVNVGDAVEINACTNTMAKLNHLKTLNYEGLACRMGDLEFMTILFGFTKLTQLKTLNFKLIQPPNVSEMAIARFVDVISKMGNLENFNIYIRRVEMPDQMIQEFVRDICRMSNVKCHRYKGSLHFYREKELGETDLDY